MAIEEMRNCGACHSMGIAAFPLFFPKLHTNFLLSVILQCVKSKSVTNLAEAAADPALDAAGNPLPLPLGAHVPTTEGPLGPVLVGHIVEAGLRMNGAPPVIDVEAIEAGLELEEGAVGGIDLNLVRPPQQQQHQQPQQQQQLQQHQQHLNDPYPQHSSTGLDNP